MTPSKNNRRSKAREVALQMLYQIDLNPDMDYHTIRDQIAERISDDALSEFCWFLFIGVMERRDELDGSIQAIAENWSLKRMAPTDRNVLRIGNYELRHTSTPPKVVIDEALELAKKFGSAASSQFVNGLLDRLIPDHRRKELDLPVEDEVDEGPEPPSPDDLDE
ncbi:MAG: transcription antitermination factor NusB [Planctomycetales bacterium]